ncbi:YqiA/YcfP family alpha/beta fold hydrolase [Microbulbifer litoralis]|uniref:YqiA/YcfP family alpha/beta fold hydrolase n=1 Tax=Microbulbifer litoralis TaxID=2933965 RepID=UPI00202945F3|nr:YqiA/YcfP family alpha/beta fold hydrolase [Microbulbifer sp. GX H0434]
MSEPTPAKRPLLLYLHGFLSSPLSHKCQLMRDWLAAEHPRIVFCAPQISPYPEIARQSLLSLVDGFVNSGEFDAIGLVGSSMGGFWASYLAERYRLPAVLVNPAVHPARFMPAYLGQTLKPYSGEPQEYRLSRVDVDTMRELEAQLQPPLAGRYWLLAQRGDETLDCREAEDFYRGQRQTIEEGGDHGFRGFARYCAPIIEFLFEDS